MATTFILNDENVINSYGFKVANAGLDIKDFKENPVMLFNHNRDKVIGKWEKIICSGSKMLADPIFDEEDEEAVKVQKKVNKGLIKGCSIGYKIDKKNITLELQKDGKEVLVIPGHLVEVSITPTPSNKSAVRLYDQDGIAALSENDILELCENFSKKNNTHMQDILKLQEENKTLKDKVQELENTLKESRKVALEQAVEDFLTKGYAEKKLSKEFGEKLKKQIANGQVSLAAAKDIVSSLPAFESITEKISKAGEKDSKTLAELQEKTFAQILQEGKAEQLKKIDIELFKTKYKEQYNKDYTQN